MKFQRTIMGALGVLSIALMLVGCQTMTGRTAGRYIDDQTITAGVKGKLVADRLANLTRVNVTTQNGVVYLTGNVDSPDRAQRAADLARSVKGVHEVVNEIQVASATPPGVASAPTVVSTAPTASNITASHPPVDVSGTVGHYDAQTGVVTFQDGRMVNISRSASVWQAERANEIQPGQHVYLRNAIPVGMQPSAAQQAAMPGAAGTWHLGTVGRVDTAANMLYLTDGTAVQIQPSTRLTLNGQPIALSQVQQGAEVAVLVAPGTASSMTPSTSAAGANALPRSAAGTASSNEIVIFNVPPAR